MARVGFKPTTARRAYFMFKINMIISRLSNLMIENKCYSLRNTYSVWN